MKSMTSVKPLNHSLLYLNIQLYHDTCYICLGREFYAINAVANLTTMGDKCCFLRVAIVSNLLSLIVLLREAELGSVPD